MTVKPDFKGRAFAWKIDCADCAILPFNDFPGKGKADADSIARRILTSVKPFKQMGDVFLVKPLYTEIILWDEGKGFDKEDIPLGACIPHSF